MEKGSGTHINDKELIPEYVKNGYTLIKGEKSN